MSNSDNILMRWPDGSFTNEKIGSDLLKVAFDAGMHIPTGCLGGRCGACEIEINGILVKACLAKVPNSKENFLKVSFASDPYW